MVMWSFKHSVRVDLNFGAAVLIDMQPVFVQSIEEKNGTRTRLIAAQKTVIRHCASRNIPVIVLELSGHGTTIEELHAELVRVPRVTEVMKTGSDGFMSSNGVLGKATDRYPSLLLMGINGIDCVLQTAGSAVNRGFTLFTSFDLLADQHNTKTHEIEKSRCWYRKNLIVAPSVGELIGQVA